ncbi:MAG TPA: hypothetical protein VFU53_04210, partial [Burkholderiales bacterium]|nr:hypothetical protein [Burkholderiales bacterium]
SNAYTARHLGEYLHILLEAAAAAGLAVADPPFYEQRDEIERAALSRAAQWMQRADDRLESTVPVERDA